ncbi:MAG: ATP-grasp domain-containing protein [Kiritimatiellia bacterium]
MLEAGELTLLEDLAPRFKINVPDFLAEPVKPSVLRRKLEEWGGGIVKPDVLSGKRGKAGALRRVSDPTEAVKMLKQAAATEVGGRSPRSAYIVQDVPADLELFTAITYDSRSLGPAFTASARGGVDVESVEEKDIVTMPVNVFQGLDAYQASDALSTLGIKGKLNSRLALQFVNQWDMFMSTGMQHCEINPWRVTKDGQMFACDFKATFDPNNFKTRDLNFRLPEYPVSETPFEAEMNAWSASSHQGQAHVADLGGSGILPILFGGGASTIVIETLALCGGDPMFLSDFGGNPPYERMKGTAEICFKHHLRKASLLLILGGKANNTFIDVTFSAIADALSEWMEANGPLKIPVVIGRGGPRLVQGFAAIRKTLEQLRLPHVIFGPDTPITLVAEYAARLAQGAKQQ